MIELMLQAERSLTVGQLGPAERLFWQAIENDPRNSIAVVGLARVALERGDDQTAYQFARKALEIDDENAAAQRLVSRLREVMEYRGEQPPTTLSPTLLIRPTSGSAGPTTSTPADSGASSGAGTGAGSGADAGGRVRRRGLIGRILGR